MNRISDTTNRHFFINYYTCFCFLFGFFKRIYLDDISNEY